MQVAARPQLPHLVEQAVGQHRVEALRERGIAATRQLAKRQLTWLRSMPRRRVVACDETGATQAAVELASALVTGDA